MPLVIFRDGDDLASVQLNNNFGLCLLANSPTPLVLSGAGTQLTVSGTAQINNLIVTGTTTFPTQAPGNNTTSVATTAFVANAVVTGSYNPAAVLITGGSVNGVTVGASSAGTGAFTSLSASSTVSGGGFTTLLSPYAPLASPALTGTPTGPTASGGTNTTQLATTAFVNAAISTGGTYNASAVVITGGTIAGVTLNSSSVGATTPSTGSFTTLTASGTVSGAGITSLLSPYAPLASPALTGVPTAPTAAGGTNTTQVATTAFVNAYAPLASPALTGTPTAPTAAGGTNTTQLATTAFVNAAVSTGGTYNAGAVVITGGSINGTTVGATTASTGAFTSLSASGTVSGAGITSLLSPYAALASPALSGTPTAPTAAVSTSTTQVATTAFVLGQVGTATPNMSSTGAVGTSLLYARQDHTHPSDTSRAPLASPALTGTPTAPTAAVATSSTQLATTAFVQAAQPIQSTRVVTASGGITALVTDVYICVKKTTGAATAVTLMTSPNNGQYVVVKDSKGDSTTNPITITPAAGTIDGASNVVLSANYGAISLLYNGTEWGIV